MKFDPVSGDLNVESGNGFIGQSGHIILLPNGMLVASNALAFTSRLNKISDAPNGIVAHHWTQQGELITLQYLAGNTLLSRWDNKLHQIDKKEFSGAPVALMGNGSELVIITNTVSTYRTHDYQVSDDSDNDGVANAEDKFPSDIAASIDTDEDGYPDSWNTGYTEQDSTSNLVLDAFLADFSCWLTEHGNSTESCDYSATFTNYIPEIVETGANENIYLYAQSHNAVYRWSTTTNQYIAPIRVGKKVLSMSVNPTAMAKSDAHGRIYLGYGDGKITYLDLTNAQEFIEQVFYTYTQPIGAISDAGNFILVQDLGEYSDNQIVLDVNGSVSDTKANYTNKFDHSIWNESNSYLYLIKPGNRLRYMNIDQSTGQIVDEGYAVYNHDDAPSGPIRISNDGTKVLLASGQLYNANDLNKIHNYGDIVDGRWLENDELVLLSQLTDHINYYRFNDNNRELEQGSLAGELVEFVMAGSTPVIISQVNERLVFTTFVANDDTDGDSVPNLVDAFPLDPAASIDSDNDGYPDEWNAGYTEADSTTNLVLDSFSNDSACWLSSHDDGNGQCNYRATLPTFTPDLVAGDDNGTVFLYSKEHNNVYRWLSSTEEYTNPISIEQSVGISLETPETMVHVASQERLYFGYASGLITYIDLGGDLIETEFYRLESAITNLVAAGNYLFVLASRDHFVFDQNGSMTDTRFGEFSRHYAWNNTNSRMYFFRDNSSPNDLYYEEIIQSTGSFGTRADSPYHGDYRIIGPIRISSDGTKVILGSGDVYNAQDLTWLGSVGAFKDAQWLDNDEAVLLNQTDDYDLPQTRLVRQNSGNTILEQKLTSGRLLGFIPTGEFYVQVSVLEEQINFEIYNANNDSDDDQVDNVNDDFPSDPAASMDTDNDGYPDSWNEGYGENDSTTNLIQDAFPNDSACWLTSHDDGAGNCDYTATMPNFVPDAVALDSEGNVYLYSAENRKVYTWSSVLEQYQNPIIVGKNYGFSDFSPTKMAYSENHQRLYFSYSTGLLTYIDLTENTQEHSFFRMSGYVGGIASVGNFMLAQDSTGAWNNHYIIDREGSLTDNRDWNYHSSHYAWNFHNQSVYYFGSNLSYEVINQTTGEISDYVDRGSSQNLKGPIRISNDGNFVLLGSGIVYHADDLTLARSVGEFADGDWLESNELVQLYQVGESISLVRSDDSGQALEIGNYDGELLHYVSNENTHVVISKVGDVLNFNLYTPNDDVDGDLVPNTEDAFPNDPSASLDSDSDGYPDEWNEGYGESDSTTGLSLDAFIEDSACWTAAHANEYGLCNFAATVPEFTPDEIVMDNFGTVYLYSAQNQKVYRWSSGSEDYMNPIPVGQITGLHAETPTKMVWSEAHSRLYFGYESGLLSYIVVNQPEISMREHFLYQIDQSVGGLASVGNYLLAQDSSGAWETHYIIDRDGLLTDKKEWNHYSSFYGWNRFNDRVYFFRDRTSPNDLEYEVIDQDSGKITDSGDSPYHGGRSFFGPIYVIGLLERVVLGTGDVFDSNSLEIVGSMPHSSSHFTTINNNIISVREVDAQWQLDLYSIGELEHLYTQGLPNPVLAMFRNEIKTVIVEQDGNAVGFTLLRLGDGDGDFIPRWWEDKYGFSDEDPTDAELDTDGDQLSNLNEYFAGTNPLLVDSDGDLLSDYDEIHVHVTNPLILDSDEDGLSDGEEVLTYDTDPTRIDSDSDSFSDGDEVLKYNTDPNDANSVPEALAGFIEGFEANSLSAVWESIADSNANWELTESRSSNGNQSLRSGTIGDSQRSSVKFDGLFNGGSLTFDAFVSSEGCCDRLYVYLNEEQIHSISNGSDWGTYQIDLPDGEAIIEWRYTKDNSASNGYDAAFIDNIEYTPQ